MNNNNNQQNTAGGGGANQAAGGTIQAAGGANQAAGSANQAGGGNNAGNTVVVPKHGGLTTTGIAWTGGSRDPAIRVYLTSYRSPLCCRSDNLNFRVWTRCEEGVKDEWKIKLNGTIPMHTREPYIHRGLMDVGVDSVFWICINGTWGDLFLHPDAVTLTEIRAHEAALSQDCPYDRENLLYSRKFLENCVDQGLRRKIAPSLLQDDGGPAFWHLIKIAKHGAETSKLMRHQKIIVETKLANVPGYDLSRYHEILLPSLIACSEANQLPLNVGPIVIANHVGPESIGYTSVLTTYAGEQAMLHDPHTQYARLTVQLDSLREISLNDPDWEKVEKSKGAYTSQLRQRDLSHLTCYGCGQKGHIKKHCPNKKKQSGNSNQSNNKNSNAKTNNNSSTNDGKLEKRWYNSNPDNKETMERDGKTYFWCQRCKWGRGTWTDHKTDDHKDKKKASSTETSADVGESGFLVMDLIESGFLSVELL